MERNDLEKERRIKKTRIEKDKLKSKTRGFNVVRQTIRGVFLSPCDTLVQRTRFVTTPKEQT